MKYEITKYTREIRYKDREEIKEGCTMDQADLFPEVVESHESLTAAREALRSYRTEVVHMSGSVPYYHVTEYCIIENEYNDDKELISGGDAWEFTEMPPEEDWR